MRYEENITEQSGTELTGKTEKHKGCRDKQTNVKEQKQIITGREGRTPK